MVFAGRITIVIRFNVQLEQSNHYTSDIPLSATGDMSTDPMSNRTFEALNLEVKPAYLKDSQSHLSAARATCKQSPAPLLDPCMYR